MVEVLEDMPGVSEVYAHDVDDEDTFKRIAVWVVRAAEQPALTADAVREWVRAQLADHSIPRDVHFVDELPRNAVGKVVPRFLPGLGQKIEPPARIELATFSLRVRCSTDGAIVAGQQCCSVEGVYRSPRGARNPQVRTRCTQGAGGPACR